jgi:hypothetical protein
MNREFGMMYKYAPNDDGYIQCTINFKYREAFEKLGFVGNAADIKKPGRKRVNRDNSKKGPDSKRVVRSDEDQRADS